MEQSIISIPPGDVDACLSRLEEAGVLDIAVLTRPDSEGRAQAEDHFAVQRELEIGRVGRCAVIGRDILRDFHKAGEALSDTLFRRGFDEKAATQLSQDLQSGRTLAFIPSKHLDVAGLRMSLEQTKDVQVYADPRLPKPVEPESADRTVGEQSESRGQSLFT